MGTAEIIRTIEQRVRGVKDSNNLRWTKDKILTKNGKLRRPRNWYFAHQLNWNSTVGFSYAPKNLQLLIIINYPTIKYTSKERKTKRPKYRTLALIKKTEARKHHKKNYTHFQENRGKWKLRASWTFIAGILFQHRFQDLR